MMKAFLKTLQNPLSLLLVLILAGAIVVVKLTRITPGSGTDEIVNRAAGIEEASSKVPTIEISSAKFQEPDAAADSSANGEGQRGGELAGQTKIPVSLRSEKINAQVGASNEADMQAIAQRAMKENQRRREMFRSAPVTQVANFPHNLKTFENWETFTAEEIANYQDSLTARLGSWSAADVETFYKNAEGRFSNAEALSNFREAVLGVWCEKDASACLASLDADAKNSALTGWVEADWMGALRFFQQIGQEEMSGHLGSNTETLLAALNRQIETEHGKKEAESLLENLRAQSPGDDRETSLSNQAK